jgi:hypothetical protein
METNMDSKTDQLVSDLKREMITLQNERSSQIEQNVKNVNSLLK